MTVNADTVCDLIADARKRQIKAQQTEDADLWVEATEDIDRLLDRLLERREVVSHGLAPVL